jgi:hypothetical protein
MGQGGVPAHGHDEPGNDLEARCFAVKWRPRIASLADGHLASRVAVPSWTGRRRRGAERSPAKTAPEPVHPPEDERLDRRCSAVETRVREAGLEGSASLQFVQRGGQSNMVQSRRGGAQRPGQSGFHVGHGVTGVDPVPPFHFTAFDQRLFDL